MSDFDDTYNPINNTLHHISQQEIGGKASNQAWHEHVHEVMTAIRSINDAGKRLYAIHELQEQNIQQFEQESPSPEEIKTAEQDVATATTPDDKRKALAKLQRLRKLREKALQAFKQRTGELNDEVSQLEAALENAAVKNPPNVPQSPLPPPAQQQAPSGAAQPTNSASSPYNGNFPVEDEDDHGFTPPPLRRDPDLHLSGSDFTEPGSNIRSSSSDVTAAGADNPPKPKYIPPTIPSQTSVSSGAPFTPGGMNSGKKPAQYVERLKDYDDDPSLYGHDIKAQTLYE